MNTKEDYDKKLEEIKAIEENQVKTPNNIPVDVYIDEILQCFRFAFRKE